ncbi:hypothetical protein QLS71_002280 [Mariniflexile litorale]|uniref:Uncharacterized protein n=1 Tax=Mariniflexile litorale TaxID=3045158 RepID=A0AAU7EHN8_9FLAO|nr:hypothetical protein [Mariniflexile sp. KMM 9835]MDQ8210702.1 hypothetical protein [Mariniflexile sp. KMM 9835]
MKNIFFSIFFLSIVTVQAQNPVITGNPASYTVIDENIEIIFNVAGAKDNGGNSLEGKDLYIWSFSSAGDSKINGSWTSIKAAAKLTKVSNTEYRLKFPIVDGANTYKTLAELYGAEAAPGSITSIGYLLRDQAPTFQTGDLTIPFAPFKFIADEVRTFPSQATTKDVVTMRFNKNFTGLSNPAMTGAQNISVHIEAIATPSMAIEMSTTFSGLYYQASIIPAASFSSLYNSGTLVELEYYFFDADNPTIKSAKGTIRLRAASH